jgi:hypothetical protein
MPHSHYQEENRAYFGSLVGVDFSSQRASKIYMDVDTSLQITIMEISSLLDGEIQCAMIEETGITVPTNKGHLPPVLRSTSITTQAKRGLPYGTPIKILYHDAY